MFVCSFIYRFIALFSSGLADYMHVNSCVCLRSRAPHTAFFFVFERNCKPQTKWNGLKSSPRTCWARFVFFECNRWIEQFLYRSRRSSAYQSCADTTHINCTVYQVEKLCSRCRTHKTTLFERKLSRGGRDATQWLPCCCCCYAFNCAGRPPYLRMELKLRGWRHVKLAPYRM